MKYILTDSRNPSGKYCSDTPQTLCCLKWYIISPPLLLNFNFYWIIFILYLNKQTVFVWGKYKFRKIDFKAKVRFNSYDLCSNLSHWKTRKNIIAIYLLTPKPCHKHWLFNCFTLSHIVIINNVLWYLCSFAS